MTALPSEPANELTAGRSLSAGAADRYVDQVCQAAVDGRRAARQLSACCKRLAISVPDFEVLWCIRFTGGHGIDQATIANRLVLSPAQVSATVERLRSSGWISQRSLAHDRRRHLWQLSDDGKSLFERMLAEFAALRSEARADGKPAAVWPAERKGAA